MEDRVRKWVTTLGVFAIGAGLLWANFSVEGAAQVRKDSIEACQRNKADRQIQKEGWSAAEQARRVQAEVTTGSEKEANLRAANQYQNLQDRLEPLINIDCYAEYKK
jgi:hypothetical protein